MPVYPGALGVHIFPVVGMVPARSRAEGEEIESTNEETDSEPCFNKTAVQRKDA